MHHIAHMLSQTDAVATQAVGRIVADPQPATAKIPDDGRFGERLKASIGATTPITTPRVAKPGDEGDRTRDAVREEAAARKSTTAQEEIIPSKDEGRKAQPAVQEEPMAAKVLGPKKAAPKEDDSSGGDACHTKPAEMQTMTQAPMQTNSLAPTQQEIVQATVAQSSVSLDSPSESGVTIKAVQSNAAGSVTNKPAKDDGKRADEAASGAAASIRTIAVTETVAQSQAIPQPPAQAGQGVELAGSPMATPHHLHMEAAATVAAPAKGSEIARTSLGAGASTPQASESKTLVATPNVLEVGIASGSHGWLRVRAELDRTGEVAASVLAGSQGVAEGLHRELPAISAYLAGERVGVNSLVVHATDKGEAAQDAATNSGAGSQSAPGQNRQESSAGRSTPSASGAASALDEVDFGSSGLNMPATIFANGTGNWLSVRV